MTVSPTGLVLKPSDGPVDRAVTIRSASGPIRVLSVSGLDSDALHEVLPSEPRPMHVLRMTLDPSRWEGGPAEIVFATDQPDQPLVSLSVLLIPDSPEERP